MGSYTVVAWTGDRMVATVLGPQAACTMIKIERLDFVPLACVHLERGAYSDRDLAQDLLELRQQMEGDLELGRKLVAVIDLNNAAPLNASQRKTLNDWRRQTHDLSQSVSLGIVFVAPSQIIRGVLTAILWLGEFGVPHKVVGTLDEAVRWAIQWLEAANLPVPERLRVELGRTFAHAKG